jgi:hypothetical protein
MSIRPQIESATVGGFRYRAAFGGSFPLTTPQFPNPFPPAGEQSPKAAPPRAPASLVAPVCAASLPFGPAVSLPLFSPYPPSSGGIYESQL